MAMDAGTPFVGVVAGAFFFVFVVSAFGAFAVFFTVGAPDLSRWFVPTQIRSDRGRVVLREIDVDDEKRERSEGPCLVLADETHVDEASIGVNEG